MSKVISFRLNSDNSRDAKALAILQDWLSQGFSTRHTITEALLNLNSTNSEITDNSVLIDLSRQINELLNSIESDVKLNKPKGDTLSQVKLSEGFVSSVQKIAKPGLRMARGSEL